MKFRTSVGMLSFAVLLAFIALSSSLNAVPSSWVYFDTPGHLNYQAWTNGNRIMDFSSSGYMGGGVAIPTNVATIVTVNPSGGDDTSAIQSAINTVAGHSLVNGIRGAVQLGAGTFRVSSQININASGVIVRGAGSTNGTTIVMTNANPFLCFSLAGSSSPSESGTANITDSYVASGTNGLNVSSASGFSVGNTVIIHRVITTNWISFMGMYPGQSGGLVTGQNWIDAGTDIPTDRKITAISGNHITLDAPLADSFDTNYLGNPAGKVAKYTWSGRISQVGLEHLRIQAPPANANYISIDMDSIIDSWVRDVTIQDGVNSFTMHNGSKRITVDQVNITRTVTISSAAPPWDFSCAGTQILYNKCQTHGTGVWPFLTAGESTGPVVLLNFFTTENGGISPHQRWSTALLSDNCSLPNAPSQTQGISYRNRANHGSGQGWTTGWSVAWNVTTPYFLVSAAPGTENWCIGGIGTKTSTTDPDGIYDQLGNIVTPHSLYLEQLRERAGGQAVENIGYTMFTLSNSPSLQSLSAGGSANFTVNVGDPTLMSNAVSLSIDTLPANLNASFSTNLVNGKGNTTLTVTASNGIAPGTYGLNVIGANAGLTHTSRVSVVVGTFSIGVSPASQSILPGDSTNYTITLTTNGGFSGSVNLSVSGLPTNTTSSFNPASLNTNGNSILTITTTTNTPVGIYSLAITATGSTLTNTTFVGLTVNGANVASPGTLWWTAASGNGINWPTAQNWTNVTSGGYGPPGISNDIVFVNLATVAASNSVDNLANISTTIASLAFNNTNAFHTTQIGAGATVSVIGSKGVTVGTESDLGNTVFVYDSVTGGGAMVVSNVSANLLVRQYTAGSSSGAVQRGTLDLSGLGNFTMIGNSIEVGNSSATGTARSAGTLYLAQSNTLQLFMRAQGVTTNAGIDVADTPTANSSQNSYLYFGQQNSIYADGITTGGGRNIGWMGFNANFTNSTAVIRGTNGDSSRVSRWFVGDNSGASNTGSNSRGTNDFTAGSIDALVDMMILGRGESPSMGSGNSTGAFLFGAGTLDVNNLQLGVQAAGATGGTTTGTGRTNYFGQMDVDGTAMLVVNSNLLMTVTNGGTAGAMNLTAMLNVNGGTVEATNIIGGNGNSTINLNSGTIDLRGGQISNVTALAVGDGVSPAAQLVNAAKIYSPNSIAIAANGTLSGNAVIATPNLIVSGAISSGTNGNGQITAMTNVTFNTGGNFVVAVQNVNGTGGSGFDFLQVNGLLSVSATNTNPFVIRLQSFNANGPGAVTNFSADTGYDWGIVSAAGGITNFAADKFTVDATAFQNNMAGGYFFVRTNGNYLVLSFTNNHSPVAGTATVYRSGNVLAIPLSALAATWSDPDGDPVALSSVGLSTDGAALGSDANFIYYTNANPVADTVFYTVADVRTNPPAIYQPDDTQRIATGQIIILPASMPVIGGVTSSGSHLIVSGTSGPANGIYYVLTSTNVALPLGQWSPLMTNAFDGNGDFLFTNSPAPNGSPTFYLLKLP